MTGAQETQLLVSDVPGEPALTVRSCLVELASGRRLVRAQLRMVVDANSVHGAFVVPLDAGTLRALARRLDEHATRIARDLIPLITQPTPPRAESLSAGQEFP